MHTWKLFVTVDKGSTTTLSKKKPSDTTTVLQIFPFMLALHHGGENVPGWKQGLQGQIDGLTMSRNYLGMMHGDQKACV